MAKINVISGGGGGGGPADLGEDLEAIAALTAADDDLIQRKAGEWTNRTPAQLKVDLDITEPEALDADLVDIAALAPADDDFIQRKAGEWTNRTPAQVKVDLGISGPTFLSSFKWGADF